MTTYVESINQTQDSLIIDHKLMKIMNICRLCTLLMKQA